MARGAPILASGACALAICLAGCGSRGGHVSSSAASAPGSTAPRSSSTTTSPAPTGPSAPHPLAVAPTTGSPTSVLRFTFTPPARSGRVGRGRISFSLIVSGGTGTGCVGRHSEAVAVTHAHQPLTVSLGPGQLGGHWCPGRYTARVDELARPTCGPAQMCPQFIRLVAVFGPARFRITG